MKRFTVCFYEGDFASRVKGTLHFEEIEVPDSYLDDPGTWVSHQRPRENYHLVFCFPKAEVETFFTSLHLQHA